MIKSDDRSPPPAGKKRTGSLLWRKARGAVHGTSEDDGTRAAKSMTVKAAIGTWLGLSDPCVVMPPSVIDVHALTRIQP